MISTNEKKETSNLIPYLLHFLKLFQLPERLDRQCIHNPLKPNNKYNSQPSLYLFNHRETGTLSTTYSFTRSVPTCTHVLRSSSTHATSRRGIRRFPSSIKGITTKRSNARKTISFLRRGQSIWHGTRVILAHRMTQSRTIRGNETYVYSLRVPRDNRRTLSNIARRQHPR